MLGEKAADGKGDYSIQCRSLHITTAHYTVKMKDSTQGTMEGADVSVVTLPGGLAHPFLLACFLEALPDRGCPTLCNFQRVGTTTLNPEFMHYSGAASPSRYILVLAIFLNLRQQPIHIQFARRPHVDSTVGDGRNAELHAQACGGASAVVELHA
jgi:hypothetical protein